MPIIARNENQIITKTPKTLPIFSVPRDCTENSATMMTSAIIIGRYGLETNVDSKTGRDSKPSTAETIDTAGVKTESARKAAPPTIAGTQSHFAYLRTSENSEKMPPSPLLSALSAIKTYSTVVISVTVQKSSESIPTIDISSQLPTPPCPATND